MDPANRFQDVTSKVDGDFSLINLPTDIENLPANLESLPPEILGKIFELLTPNDLGQLSEVSQRMRDLVAVQINRRAVPLSDLGATDMDKAIHLVSKFSPHLEILNLFDNARRRINVDLFLQ